MSQALVLFYKGKSRIFNRLVSWWTRGKYSHVEIVIDGIWYSSSGMDGGVRAKKIDFDSSKWDIVHVECDHAQVVRWFERNESKKYDYLGLFGFIFRVVEGDKDKYFCSEAVAASLGIIDPWRYCPNTLFSALSKRESSHV